MEINGEEITQEQFMGLLKLEHTATPESEAKFEAMEKERLEAEAQSRISSSNRIAEIPRNFWNVQFSDYPSDFADKSKSLALDYSSNNVVILFGDVGRGKTHTLCSAIHERARDGDWDCLYYNIRNLRLDLSSCRNYSNGKDELSFMQKLTDVPFLCLDEVGTCSNRQWESEFLNDLLCDRCDNQLPTWIATNLSPVDFKSLICNRDISGLSTEELIKAAKEMDEINPTLNRIKSVIITKTLKGPSFREVKNDTTNTL